MFLVASELKSQIHGLIGIAAAPDFTQNLIWNKLSKSKQKEFTNTYRNNSLIEK